ALDQAARSAALSALLKRDEILQSRRKRGDPRSDEEIDDVRRKAIDFIDLGTLRATFSRDSKVLGTFVGTDKMAAPIAGRTSWFGLRSLTEPFVLSDHPVLVHDPQAGPDEPVSWFSSPTVEVAFPLDPSYCLLLSTGPATYKEVWVAP